MTLYRDHDYEFGRAMLNLRSTIGLTQATLADQLGVSRRSVADWEAGNNYPKVGHLKTLIAFAAQQRAFTRGHETDEIRALWHLSRQKVLLDERWLAAILNPNSPIPQAISQPAPPAVATKAPRTDWNNALDIPDFYGRTQEISLLTDWVIRERCRVITVLGLGGIGKSALVVSVMRQVADQFDVVIWRSLRDAPSCEALIDDCLQALEPQALDQAPAGLDRRLALLLQYLRSARVLLVLDNLEVLLEEGDKTGQMRPEHEGYARLLRRLAETEHQSCVLLTSREKPGELITLEGTQSRVRTLRLSQLDIMACEKNPARKGRRRQRSRPGRIDCNLRGQSTGPENCRPHHL